MPDSIRILPAYGLRFMIEPSISKRRICDSLARLYKNGLITKRYDSCIGDHVPFYGLSRLKHKARKIITLTEASPTDQAFVKPTKITEPIHWMYTSILFHRIKKMFLNCPVKRGQRGIDMPSDARQPDLILSIFAPSSDQSIQIAIYVEIDIKSEKMIKQRLNRHLAHPCFDIVIIADCDDEVFRTAEIIRKSKRFNRAQWMFLSNDFVQNDEPLVLYNSELKNILFQILCRKFKTKSA